jgi:DNA-binding beta-propeller fold protein YncE
MAFDAAGNLFFCDFGNNRVRRVDARTGTISTVAGRGAPTSDGDGGPAPLGGINGPTTVQVDGSGTLFVADFNGQRIRRIDGATRTITTVAGDGTSGFAGDGGPATAARFYNPEAVLLDRATGDLYVSDAGNGRIRRIDAATGTVSTVAGGGSSLDGDVAAASASLAPLGLALHPGSGTLFFTEPYYGILRQVTGLVPPHGSP